MIFTSDAVYMGEEDFYRSVEKLRGIQERTGAQLVFGHDAEQIHQLRVGPKESYT